jgi:hypothetical protein
MLYSSGNQWNYDDDEHNINSRQHTITLSFFASESNGEMGREEKTGILSGARELKLKIPGILLLFN